MSGGAHVTAYVGLGANIGEPVASVRAGMRALETLPGTRLVRCSSLYGSAPVGFVAQPDFVNAVCRVDTTLPAAELMQRLLDIERAHGRGRGPDKGGPRTLDLDLLLYGAERLEAPELTLPHPRLHERAFVLAPLTELDPGIEIPGHGRVDELLAACTGQRLEPLAD